MIFKYGREILEIAQWCKEFALQSAYLDLTPIVAYCPQAHQKWYLSTVRSKPAEHTVIAPNI